MFTFLYRAIKFAIQSFFRNFWLSLVTIIILVLTLFSVTLLGGINFIGEQTIQSIKDKVDVSIYFKSEVGEDEVLKVMQRMEGLPQTKEVTYVSREEALELFRENHKDDPVILESINELEENPLSATLIVKANSIDEYDEILALLDQAEYSELIEESNFDDNEKIISRLSDISNKIQNVGLIVSGIFIIIAILIVFNTIRINIYTHREEIGIMKLVGASNWFVRAPFLFESIMYAVVAVVIGLAILYPLLGTIVPQVDNFFEGANLDLVEYFNSNFLRILGWQLAFAVMLSIISSSIAIGRYLRV